jgi:uncharacterized membrane protein (DUF4010 family)
MGLALLILALINYGSVFFVMLGQKKHHEKEIHLKSPFAIWPALKFGLLYLAVLFLVDLGAVFFGDWGVYVVAVISGLIGMNAIIVSVASLTSDAAITLATASKAVLLAIISNTVFKMSLAWMHGRREFSIKVIEALGLVLVCTIIALFLI